ncbi:hypothetical protein CC1G_03975 [Coprinopsis cinerea okayama7|uniref:Uncharacterized protein n=1 Tax=Coprinopsis cinerea (strain Okayama-7 / 130 / ATCC MYA-4618 / FGSC 9003) TaxID=240176 RepID=A8N8C8_COPC7|nr:hypothetical protein CC1G_03975 [Coprinopsis cinerea okayama7\|eukprot:XP_001831084.2 hypothetical protein CC1G_03975 [Coprinopsis cinerea okayama7\
MASSSKNQQQWPEESPPLAAGPLVDNIEGVGGEGDADDPEFNHKHGLYFYFGQEAGGFQMPWGIHRGKRMHDVPYSYLMWCFINLTLARSFRAAFVRYRAGLIEYAERLQERNYRDFVVPLGKKHRGKKIFQVRDIKWMKWLQKPIGRRKELREKFDVFFRALDLYLKYGRRRYEATRDIGQLLKDEEYGDDELTDEEDLDYVLTDDEDTDDPLDEDDYEDDVADDVGYETFEQHCKSDLDEALTKDGDLADIVQPDDAPIEYETTEDELERADRELEEGEGALTDSERAASVVSSGDSAEVSESEAEFSDSASSSSGFISSTTPVTSTYDGSDDEASVAEGSDAERGASAHRRSKRLAEKSTTPLVESTVESDEEVEDEDVEPPPKIPRKQRPTRAREIIEISDSDESVAGPAHPTPRKASRYSPRIKTAKRIVESSDESEGESTVKEYTPAVKTPTTSQKIAPRRVESSDESEVKEMESAPTSTPRRRAAQNVVQDESEADSTAGDEERPEPGPSTPRRGRPSMQLATPPATKRKRSSRKPHVDFDDQDYVESDCSLTEPATERRMTRSMGPARLSFEPGQSGDEQSIDESEDSDSESVTVESDRPAEPDRIAVTLSDNSDSEDDMPLDQLFTRTRQRLEDAAPRRETPIIQASSEVPSTPGPSSQRQRNFRQESSVPRVPRPFPMSPPPTVRPQRDEVPRTPRPFPVSPLEREERDVEMERDELEVVGGRRGKERGVLMTPPSSPSPSSSMVGGGKRKRREDLFGE